MHKGKRFALERKMVVIRVAVILMPLAAALLLLSRHVSAQTTYVITDGNRVLIHTSAEKDPKDVLDEAGVQLGMDDTYSTEDSQIHIHRDHRKKLNRDEEQMEIIREKQTYTAILDHDTIYCNDASLPEGTERVITAGVDGEILCEATVTYTNGEETERLILSHQVVTQPVNEIVAVGCSMDEPEREEKSQMAVIGSSTITLPTGEVLTYTEKVTCLATAYCCEGYVGTTATGTRARVGAIAVDPSVFPYGTRFYIVTQDGEYIYGVATAEDCGDKRFIHDTRLDLYFNTRYECVQFGARKCDVYILG